MMASQAEPVGADDSRRSTLAAGVLFAAVAAVAYHNSLSVPLIFDDARTIADNPSIHELSRLGAVLNPPANVFTAGRPFLNFTFAVNYAIGGTSVIGYHVGNLIIHVLAALTLFGLIRRLALRRQSPDEKERTLETEPPPDRDPAEMGTGRPRPVGMHFGMHSPARGRAGPSKTYHAKQHFEASAIAIAVALAWVAHPVATNAVTYISQRAESLMALCALLTLYCFVRGASATRPLRWYAASVVACALGMATKEVMAVVPVVVLIADRTFFADSFAVALRTRGRFYAALAATWLLLAELMASSSLATRDVGFTGSYSAWSYFVTECPVVGRYIGLALWPHPLVFDYGAEMPRPELASLLWPGLWLLLAVSATLRELWRGGVTGFLGAAFFLLLAPTSSFVPVQEQPMAESRLYLPLAAIAAIAVVGLRRAIGRRSFIVCGAIGVAFVTLAAARNRTYGSERSLWHDTVIKRPGSSRAHNTLAAVLLEPPVKLSLAQAHAEAAVRIKPDFANAHYNLGVALSSQPARRADALAHFEIALRLRPNYPEAHNNLANLLAADPVQRAEAMRHYRAALAANPQLAEAHYNLANLLAGDPNETMERIRHYQAALRLRPDLAGALFSLGTLLAELPGRETEAVGCFERALAIAPNNAAAHFNLATTLLRLPNRQPEAIGHYREALRLRPDLEAAREMLRQLGAPAAP